MFNLMKEVRNRPRRRARVVLGMWLASEPERFDGINDLPSEPAQREPHPLPARADHSVARRAARDRYALRRLRDRSRTYPVRGRAHLGSHYERHTRRVRHRSTSSRTIATSSATCSCCRRTSTQASATCPTRRRSSTTTHRTPSLGRFTRWHTRTTQLPRLRDEYQLPFAPYPASSRRLTSMLGRSSTVGSPRSSGTPADRTRRRCVT